MMLLRFLLGTTTSLGAIAAALALLYHYGAVLSLVGTFIGWLIYTLLRAHPKRHQRLWQLAGLGGTSSTADLTLGRQYPTVILSYSRADLIQHVSAYGGDNFATSTILMRGDQRKFTLPLSRGVIAVLGGLMPYTRALLLRLMQRKGRAVIILNTINPGDSVSMKQKGVFTAARQVGATLIVTIVDKGVVRASDHIIVEPCPSLPNVDDVLRTAADVSRALVELHRKSFGTVLHVTDVLQ